MEKKIEKLRKEADKLQAIKSRFPDLSEVRDRWGTVRLSAKSANAQCTKIETRHSCGCCNDAPFLAMPYVEFEGDRIYSDPERICIGEKSTSYYGDVWDEDWEDRLKKIGIPEAAIETLRPAFDKDNRRREAYNNYQDDIDSID